jgi:cephalosporin-C deacetylase
MPLFDLPLDQLVGYAPDLPEPGDFDEFWKTTLAEEEHRDLAATFTPADAGLRLVESYDVTFAGFGGELVKGWLHLPVHRSGPLPCVIQFAGYGGGRGLAHESVLWAVAGYAHFTMDTRGQGSSGSLGDTPDAHGSTPAVPGFMTKGVLDPADYYYRRVFTDAVRAVAAARSHPAVDAERVVVSGGSQGGGIALAAAALVPDLAGLMCDVPFLCHFRRATEVIETDPYGEISRYLARHREHLDTVFSTLSYFDGAIMARRGRAAALFSVALMDTTCPPSTVYAVYNAYPGRKEIRVYPYNKHEGGQSVQQGEQLRWLPTVVGL